MWQYICDRCDHAGVWEVDFETASYYIGQKIDIKMTETLFEKQYLKLNNGARWLIKDFIIFQYGHLSDKNTMYLPVKSILSRYGVLVEDIMEDKWGINPRKDKVKDKAKDKDSNKGGVGGKEIDPATYPYLTDPFFADAFTAYLSGRKTKATQRAKELILKDLHKHSLETAIAMLEQSIKHGWIGVFELKKENNYGRSKASDGKSSQYRGIETEIQV